MTSPDAPSFRFDATHGPEMDEALVLDEATFGALQELAGDDDPDLVAELVELFLDDSRVRMGEIRSALDAGDGERVGRAAHALKSSSANIGALAFSGLCAELERTARRDGTSPTELEELVDRALRTYGEVCEALGDDTADAD